MEAAAMALKHLCSRASALETARFVVNLPATGIGYVWARAHRARCRWEAGLVLACGEMRGGYPRGGFTVGNVWMYGDLGGDARLRHEAVHATQWALFGPLLFPVLYGLESLRTWRDPRRNVFERWAGLRDGGYI